MTDNEFSGIWCCRYWFPSNANPGEEEPSEYQVTIRQRDNKLILESLPNQEESYMLVRLKLDGEVVGGSWQENTSPHGEFKSMIYSGLVQLLYDKEAKRMDGMWVGIGRDHKAGKPAIYTGRWEISYLGEEQISRAEVGPSTVAKNQ
jgi:hypothetical protein